MDERYLSVSVLLQARLTDKADACVERVRTWDALHSRLYQHPEARLVLRNETSFPGSPLRECRYLFRDSTVTGHRCRPQVLQLR